MLLNELVILLKITKYPIFVHFGFPYLQGFQTEFY